MFESNTLNTHSYSFIHSSIQKPKTISIPTFPTLSSVLTCFSHPTLVDRDRSKGSVADAQEPSHVWPEAQLLGCLRLPCGTRPGAGTFQGLDRVFSGSVGLQWERGPVGFLFDRVLFRLFSDQIGSVIFVESLLIKSIFKKIPGVQ